MKKFVVTTAAAGALAAAALGLAGTAAAFPSNGNAADTIKALQDEGYNVQVNRVTGSSNTSLSKCLVTGTHPSNLDSSASRQAKQQTLVTIDASCPNHDN